jgi:replicative DNA helicase
VEYRAGVLTLLNLPLNKDADGEVCPWVLMLTANALDALQKFENWIEPQLAEFGALGGMSDWGGKIVGAVARIAGLLHMAAMTGETAPWKTPIPETTINRAIQIGKYLIPHARAAFAEMGADPVVEHAKKILCWIEHGGFSSFTRRDAQQALRSTFRRPEEMDAPLKILAEHAFIYQQPSHVTGPGRKPSPMFEVNPYWNSWNDSAPGIGSGKSEYFEYSEQANGPQGVKRRKSLS